jgi:hypothetical protein
VKYLTQARWTPSSRVDPELLDDRPPFLGISLHQRAKHLRRLPLARDNLKPEIGEARPHRWIGQCLDGPRLGAAIRISCEYGTSCVRA